MIIPTLSRYNEMSDEHPELDKTLWAEIAAMRENIVDVLDALRLQHAPSNLAHVWLDGPACSCGMRESYAEENVRWRDCETARLVFVSYEFDMVEWLVSELHHTQVAESEQRRQLAKDAEFLAEAARRGYAPVAST